MAGPQLRRVAHDPERLSGQAGIDVDLLGTGPTHIHLAHLASTGNIRGMELRNLGPSAAGRVIVAKIVDNDLYDNTAGLGEASGSSTSRAPTAAESGPAEREPRPRERHRVARREQLVELRRDLVLSSGDRFFENGAGASSPVG